MKWYMVNHKAEKAAMEVEPGTPGSVREDKFKWLSDFNINITIMPIVYLTTVLLKVYSDKSRQGTYR